MSSTLLREVRANGGPRELTHPKYGMAHEVCPCDEPTFLRPKGRDRHPSTFVIRP